MTEPCSRRRFLALTSGLASAAALPTGAVAQNQAVRGSAEDTRAAIRRITGVAEVRVGRVKVDLPPLVDNGNTVPLAVSVDSPMTIDDHVKAIHVFSERNPEPVMTSFHLGPRSGRALVGTRVRLADTQNVIAIAQMSDGSFWSGSVNVVVTISSCLEDIL